MITESFNPPNSFEFAMIPDFHGHRAIRVVRRNPKLGDFVFQCGESETWKQAVERCRAECEAMDINARRLAREAP